MNEQRTRPQPDAYTRAIGLLARREHSRKELGIKLTSRGFEPDQIESALGQLVEQGYLSDGRFAEMLVRTRIGAGQGPLRIRAELATHAIDDVCIDAAFDEQQTDWTASARRVIERRYSAAQLDDADLRRKAIGFLLRRGFELDCARQATIATQE